jgi:hypothetical protein
VAPQGEVQTLDLRRYFRRKLQGDLEALPYNTDCVALVDALPAFLRRDPAPKQLLADFERAGDRAALELETVIAEVLGGSGESERP